MVEAWCSVHLYRAGSGGSSNKKHNMWPLWTTNGAKRSGGALTAKITAWYANYLKNNKKKVTLKNDNKVPSESRQSYWKALMPFGRSVWSLAIQKDCRLRIFGFVCLLICSIGERMMIFTLWFSELKWWTYGRLLPLLVLWWRISDLVLLKRVYNVVVLPTYCFWHNEHVMR